MSVEMQSAFENDMTFTDESGKVNYVEGDADIIDMEVIEQPEQPQEENIESSGNEPNAAAAALFGK